jgi:large subunit ribosomal protein L4
MRRAALLSALSHRLQESALTIVDELEIDGFKTKRMLEILGVLGLAGGSVLVVIDEPNATVEASARNLPGVAVVRSEGLNVYDLLRHKSLLFTKAAIAQLETRLASASGEGAPK